MEENLPWPTGTGMLRVADLQVDLRYRQVITPEQTVELPQRVFDVLLILLCQPHVLHSRTVLLERVWAGVVVEDANLSQSIWTLRRALGPARKHWIHTVAKGGYVFEPPGPVAAMPTGYPGAETDVAPASGTIVTNPAGSGSPPRAGDPHRRIQPGWLAAIGAIAVILLVGLLSLSRPGGPPEPLEPLTPVSVALIEVGNREDTDARWPATMLHAWLEWKLTAMPEVMLLTEAHLAADTADSSPQVVLLSAGKSADKPDERFVRARFDAPGGNRQLELRGSATRMPQLIDDLSRQVLAELVPARREDPWPTLQIDEPTVRAYASAYRAYAARDMASAATELAALIQQAPRFGLAHLQLAMAQARLGQARAAQEHMEQAGQLLTPVAADVARVLEATALSVDPRRARETANAFADLSAQYPQRISFRLEQAWNEMRSGDPDDALATLAGTDWNRQPLGIRVHWLLTLAAIEGVRLNSEGVRQHAEDAAELARAAGTGWERELAEATLLQAQVDAFQLGPEAGLEGFEEAARLFSAAGVEIDAMFARVSGELTQPPQGRSAQLDSLLAHARAGGYRNIEVQLLRRAAFQQRSAGNLVEYRKRLEDALAIAESAGDPTEQRALHVDLLSEDLLLGRFERANERIRLIRSDPPKGDAATWLDQFEGFLLSASGDYPAAMQALDQTIDRLDREGRQPLPGDTLARLACDRTGLMLSQGQLHEARAQRDLCASTEQAYLRDYAITLGATIDLMAGDTGTALPALHRRVEAIQTMPHAPDRWHAALSTAYLLSRAGDLDSAAALFNRSHAALQDTGYQWLLADAEVGLAEIATAQGRWAEATRWAEHARERLPAAAWQQFHRIDQVGILVAFASGAHDEAQSRLLASDARAHQVGDVTAQLELHSLLGALTPYFRPDDRGCDANARKALVATTGMRGANLDWMRRALPASEQRVAMASHETGRIMGRDSP